MFIDDQTGTLSDFDVKSIQQTETALDVKVVVTTSATRAELDAQVGKMVTSANTLAIGIDPVHHYSFTHFGTGTGIARDDYATIARAGNGEFHLGHWGAGVKAIVASATASIHDQHGAVIIQEHATVVEHPVPVLPFVIGGAGLLLFAIFFWRWIRRRQDGIETTLDDFRDEAQTMRTRNLEEQGWHDQYKDSHSNPSPAARPPAPAAPPIKRVVGRRAVTYNRPAAPSPMGPVIISQGNNGNDMLTGMLVGEAISRPAPVIVESPAPSRSYESDSGNSGGSSSSSFDSSPSFDSGSSGGSFDGGGGGFDSGGGGGSF